MRPNEIANVKIVKQYFFLYIVVGLVIRLF